MGLYVGAVMSGVQDIVEDLERIGAVASSSDLKGCCALFGVFPWELGDTMCVFCL